MCMCVCADLRGGIVKTVVALGVIQQDSEEFLVFIIFIYTIKIQRMAGMGFLVPSDLSALFREEVAAQNTTGSSFMLQPLGFWMASDVAKRKMRQRIPQLLV